MGPLGSDDDGYAFVARTRGRLPSCWLPVKEVCYSQGASLHGNQSGFIRIDGSERAWIRTHNLTIDDDGTNGDRDGGFASSNIRYVRTGLNSRHPPGYGH